MLTPAQYEALKTWPDGCSLPIKSVDIFSTVYSRLLGKGLILQSQSSNSYEKNQPACSDAISEYEASQNGSGK